MSSFDHLRYPRCLASTGDTFCRTIQDCSRDAVFHRGRDSGNETNFFREAQFTADGTSIVTYNEDQCLRTFGLPTDTSNETGSLSTLKPYATYQSASNIQSYAVYPYFDVQNPATSVVLCASASVPIALRNCLDYNCVHAKYPLIHPQNEEHLSARSLIFSTAATHFIAGANDQISIFDCYRDGSNPIITHKLRSGRRKMQATGGWQMCKGSTMAMSISCDGILAIGTTAREVALFDHEGAGQCTAVFSVAAPALSFTESRQTLARGTGVTDLKWSPCGKYLLVAERRSDVVQIYDIRGSGTVLATLWGRNADTPQRMGIHLLPTSNGFDVWAGGTDGNVRIWKDPTSLEGNHDPDTSFRMHDGNHSVL